MASSCLALLCLVAAASEAAGKNAGTEGLYLLQRAHRKVWAQVDTTDEPCDVMGEADCVGAMPAPEAPLHCDGSLGGGTEPAQLSGFYHDLHDDNKKKIEVRYEKTSEEATMVITPPEPGTKYYTEGVGKGWKVTATVEGSCAAPSIDFDVAGKPSPPDSPVAAKFQYGKLSDLEFVQECLNPFVTADCGALVEYPQIHCDRPVWTLNFGGNVWVLDGAPTLGPAPAAEALHCDGSPGGATEAAQLSGFYHDLHDNNNKKVEVAYEKDSEELIMVITPPEPGTEFYTPGVGNGWMVTAAVEESCAAPSINFDVCGKPYPPLVPVAAKFQFGKLSELEFVRDCLKPDTTADCGAVAEYPDIHSEEPVWALNFGGNVWVLRGTAPGSDR